MWPPKAAAPVRSPITAADFMADAASIYSTALLRRKRVIAMTYADANWPFSAPKCSLAYARAAVAVLNVCGCKVEVTIG